MPVALPKIVMISFGLAGWRAWLWPGRIKAQMLNCDSSSSERGIVDLRVHVRGSTLDFPLITFFLLAQPGSAHKERPPQVTRVRLTHFEDDIRVG